MVIDWNKPFVSVAKVEALHKRIAELEAELAALRATTVAAPEPDWSQAPEWAMWWAVDSWGIRLWFQREPRTDMGKWREPLHGESLLEYDGPGEELPLGVDWRTTLRKRPEVSGE